MLWPKEKAKRTNNDLQNITQKLKMKATRTPINTGEGDEVRCTGSVGSSCFTCDTLLNFRCIINIFFHIVLIRCPITLCFDIM